jgi:two-component system OmpR family response regulator
MPSGEALSFRVAAAVERSATKRECLCPGDQLAGIIAQEEDYVSHEHDNGDADQDPHCKAFRLHAATRQDIAVAWTKNAVKLLISQSLTNKSVFNFRFMIGWRLRTPSDVVGRCEIMAGGRRRILVVEDDPESAEQLVDFLATSGYQADVAVNGDDGLRRGRSADYAVMTIDRMLPGMDGIAVIRRLREDGIVTPALIISALGEVDDRVRGLRAGGDDYLVKPFAFAELLARVEALARRSATVVKETVLRVGDLELDLVSRTVRRGGQEIELLPREFQVLEYLVRNEGQVIPRAMLLQHVWDLHFDPTTNIIDVYVGRVRRKVDGKQAYPLIHTVRGVGFCVRAPC